jgi:tetratricopeptide (TPR) repeat protein
MVHRYAAEKSMKLLLLTCLSFFLALLSKEYGVVLLVLIPISLYLFDEQGFQISKYVPLMGGLIAVFALYYGIRSTIVIGESNLQDAELLNNPFLLADEGQKLATKLFIFLKYFLVMLIPHPLSSDYGYNSIPYKDFGDWQVWAGILFLIACFAGLYLMLRKRHWSAFAIAFYLFTLLLVTNLIFNIGATMGERLAFHASLGFCMLVGYGLVYIGDRFNKKMLTWLLLLPILFLYSFKTHTRNRAWENDITLALTDVEIMPESTALNGNAASRNLDLSEMPKNKDREKELIRNAIGYAKKSVQLHDRFVNGYLNLGLGYAKLEQYDSAKVVWDKAFQIYPSHPSKSLYYNLLADAYYRKGFAFGAEKNWTEGKRFLEKAIEVSPDNARYWYDLGGFAYNAADYASAKAAWDKAFQLAPNDTLIQRVQQVFK